MIDACTAMNDEQWSIGPGADDLIPDTATFDRNESLTVCNVRRCTGAQRQECACADEATCSFHWGRPPVGDVKIRSSSPTVRTIAANRVLLRNGSNSLSLN